MTTTENTVLESITIEGEYGFRKTYAIVEHHKHGRILLCQGFGGMHDLSGGAVRWRHGAAYQLRPSDTLEALQNEEWNPFCSLFDAVVGSHDNRRPYLHWSGDAVDTLATSLGL